MRTPILFINCDAYKKLNTKYKILRSTKFVNMLLEIDSGILDNKALSYRMTVIRRYMYKEDLQYMTKEEIDLFRYYDFIDSNNEIIREFVGVF
jgi:hypothetical protein